MIVRQNHLVEPKIMFGVLMENKWCMLPRKNMALNMQLAPILIYTAMTSLPAKQPI